ncbi:hypothetical protein PoB_003456000 [Plakobranchus ocellatus]|uniref:Uncharacterized protein n=1 Tax=Plakobranchus ocellatus TaxID=259542 RepID=A0AAV4AME0_9GAST|nr:hypothetical protein PoB_003456000 [Plakobranchus ocellatus]
MRKSLNGVGTSSQVPKSTILPTTVDAASMSCTDMVLYVSWLPQELHFFSCMFGMEGPWTCLSGVLEISWSAALNKLEVL